MLCPACKTPVPVSTSECPACGTSTPVDSGATEIVASPTADDRTQVSEAPGWSKAFTASDLLAYRNAGLTEGSVLGGRYKILKTLGEGGMGAVFQAHDSEVDRIVALKMIRQELAGSADMLRRFRQELVLARQITHPNVVRIYDLGVTEGGRFISMEYIEGRELGSILEERGKLPPKEAAELMVQACRGLGAAHAQGVVHRDLKPQNIMVDKQGRVAVMDFGIAHSTEAGVLMVQGAAAGAGQGSNLTQMGAVIGTPRYMSPEQARAEKLDHRSDLFTVGLILYELTTGGLPPTPGTLPEILTDRGSKQIAAPVEVNPQIPRPLNKIICRCLQLDPANRYQSADHLVRELEIWLGARKRHQTNWTLVSSMVGLILLLAAALVYNARPRATSAHAPVKILISDLTNNTGNPVLNGTLEPVLSAVLEGAPFITAYNRGDARKTLESRSGSNATLDENSARLVAQREGVGVVVSGSIGREGNKYSVSARALDARTNKVIDEQRATASTPAELNRAAGRIASGFRKALGDFTPRSEQMAAAETFSSQSLEASQQYALGQEMQWKGKWDEALTAYSQSTRLDPNLGRAYAGMAVILANMGRKQDAEKDFKLAMSKIDRMTDREKFRTRGGYYLLERDYDKAIEQFKALEKQYPADSAGIANLALAYFYQRNMSAALEEGRRAVAIYPANLLQLNNVGLFAMYAGDFDTAVRESQRLLSLNASFEKAYICLGIAQFAQGNEAAAAETFKKLGTLSPWGASASAVGLADMALYKGRPDEAIEALETGLAGDLAAHDSSRPTAKWVMTAEAWMMKGDKSKAVAAAGRASNGSTDENILYPSAMIFLEAGQPEKAEELSRKLGQRLEPDPGAYSKLILAEEQLKRGQYRDAVQTFKEAQKISDTWLGRFGLGRAYLGAGAYTEADAELDACVKRRGEATAVFLDDEPSWRYFAPVYYYLGRAREGLQSPGASDAYRSFLKIREKSTNDPLAADAGKRLQSLEKTAAR